ncbi:unnamed protein product [Caenorhabditis auriculariae]|uniref:Uncharacterized protein n=1 Tax=Caenorhabditis auriculariae TaxID=2777116 RepID=A0A8S1HIA2_9PELO|nr:unnamed protein product [Caenorhabditis auriculariae]
MLSHIPLVKDFDKLRTFYLRAYVRYIRWLISVGSSPRAIANIQATFEVNFGAGAKCRQTNLKEREADLRFYWNTSMPRIGDSPEILGMAEELKNYGQMSSAEILELEKTDSELQKHQMMVAVTDDLCDLNEPIGRCWVRFERRMETADARVKRHPLEVSDAQELELMELEDTVKEDEITPYYSFRDQDVDFIMPLLQALGVKFVGGNEVYSSSDDILQAWFDGCNQNCSEFRTLPSAKPLLPCRKIGVNILRYLYDKIFTFESGHPLHRVFYSSEALTEFSIVEADSTLSTSLEKLKYFFSKGGPLIKPNMSMEASHIILLVLADKVSKLAFQAKREAQNQGPKAKAITDKAVEKLIMLLRNVIRSKSTEQERLLGVSPYTKSQELNSIQRDFLALITVLKFFDDPQVKSRNIAALLLGMDTEKADKLSNVDLRRAVTTIEGIQENIYKIEQKENEPNSHKSSLHVLPTASVLLDVLIMHLRVNIAVQDAKDSTEANYAIDRLMDVSKVVRGSDNETYRNINLRFIHTELILAIGSKFIFRDRFCSVLHLAIEHLRFEPFIWITYIETFNRGSKRLTTSIFMSHRQIFVQEVAEKDPNIYSDVERLFMSLGLLYMQCRHYRSLDEHLGSDSILKRLLTSFTEQATLTRDPSIWRLALRVAVELGNQRLIQETHVLANGQCSWARDIHLDYAMAQTNENGFQQAMLAILESNSHLFIDDVKNIEAIREIHQAKQMLE